jgi:hypothetical protein
VLRRSVLSIVLLLAIGQDTALLCTVWCHPGGAAMPACHDQIQNSGKSLSVKEDDSCGRVMVGGALLIREDLRRVPDHDARYAVVVPRFHVPSSPNDARRCSDPGRASPLESRPLIVALRI